MKKKTYTTKEGYRQVYSPGTPGARENGFVPQHRLTASKMIGRPLHSDEIVHHINGDKLDNRKKNLLITNRSEHYRIHHSKKK